MRSWVRISRGTAVGDIIFFKAERIFSPGWETGSRASSQPGLDLISPLVDQAYHWTEEYMDSQSLCVYSWMFIMFFLLFWWLVIFVFACHSCASLHKFTYLLQWAVSILHYLNSICCISMHGYIIMATTTNVFFILNFLQRFHQRSSICMWKRLTNLGVCCKGSY